MNKIIRLSEKNRSFDRSTAAIDLNVLLSYEFVKDV